MSRRRKRQSRRPNRADERRHEANLRNDIARALDRMPTSPALTAWADQHHAASRDLGQMVTGPLAAMLTAAGLKGVKTDTTTPPDMPGLLALVVAAVQRRGITYCPHFHDAQGAHETVMLSLGARTAACRDCVSTVMAMYPDAESYDDGRCDVCNQPVSDGMFYPFVFALGTAIVQGDTGDCCRPAFTAATGVAA